jgi:hypothetical protein
VSAVAAAPVTGPWAPTPFSATYTVQWKSFNAGTAYVELVSAGGDLWRYSSRNVARGVFNLAFPDAITQVADFQFKDGVLRPLRYRGDDGGKSTKRDVSLDFDWERRRVTGIAEEVPVDFEILPNLLDSMTVQIAQIQAAATGSTPVIFRAIDKDRIKEYEFRREGAERVKTPLGEFDAEIYTSRRAGSSRTTRLWMVPSLGYVSVRAERRKGSSLEFAMAIRELKQP